MRKLGINTDFLSKELGFAAGYAAVAKAGFQSIFVCDENAEETEAHILAAKGAGLTVDFLHSPWHKINSLWLEGELGETILARLKQTVDICAKHGIPVAIVHLSSGEKAPCINDLGHRRFDELIAHAEEKGVKLAFENQRKLANIAFIFELHKENPTVGFCWDSGHESCFTMGKIDYMALFSDRLLALHLHDNEGVFDKDSHLLPFDSACDMARVAEKIKRSGYEGTVMLEIKREKYKDLSVEAFLARAYAAADKLRSMIDG